MVKRLVKVVGALAVVTLLGLFAVGAAFADGPTPTPTPATPWGRAWGGIYNGYAVVSDAISSLLGMTPEQIYDARAAGKTLSDLAKSKGITDQQLIDAMLAGQRSVIEQAVQAGQLTQAQADWMLARMQAMAPYSVTNPFAPGAMGHGPFGRGGRGPWGVTPPTTTQ